MDKESERDFTKADKLNREMSKIDNISIRDLDQDKVNELLGNA